MIETVIKCNKVATTKTTKNPHKKKNPHGTVAHTIVLMTSMILKFKMSTSACVTIVSHNVFIKLFIALDLYADVASHTV